MRSTNFAVAVLILISVTLSVEAQDASVTASLEINPVLTVVPQSIEATVAPLSFFDRIVSIRAAKESELQISVSGDVASWVIPSAWNISLSAGEEINVTLQFSIPDVEAGKHTGVVHFGELSVPVEIEVTEDYFLTADVDVSRFLIFGNELEISGTVGRESAVDNFEGWIIVEEEYVVRGWRGFITSFNVTREVEDPVSESFIVDIPDDARSGLYAVTLTVTHRDKRAVDRDRFILINRRGFWR